MKDVLVLCAESIKSLGLKDGDQVDTKVTGPVTILPGGMGVVECSCAGEGESETETEPETETETEAPEAEGEMMGEGGMSPESMAALGKPSKKAK